MTTPYQKGARVERELANELREQGWIVIRSAGSKGPADLVAYHKPEVRIIQVKACKTMSEMRAAVKEAIEKFNCDGAWFDQRVHFYVYLRFQGKWIVVWRSLGCWRTFIEYEPLLGRKEWPTKNEEVT